MRHKWFRSDLASGISPQNGAMVQMLSDDIIPGAAIVTKGEVRGHGVYIDDEFLDDVTRMGNEKKQGLKIRFGHPTMSGEALGTFLGRAKNFWRDGDIARADLYLSDVAKNSPDGDLKTYVKNMAEHEPDMFGSSIVFTPGREYRKTDTGEKIFPPELSDARDDSDELNDIYSNAGPETFIEIDELHGADVVDQPAANDGMFSAFSTGLTASEVTSFLDSHPEIWKIIDDHPDAVEPFIKRYSEYRQTPTEENHMAEDISTVEPTEPVETIDPREVKQFDELDVEVAVENAKKESLKMFQAMAEEFDGQAVEYFTAGLSMDEARKSHLGFLKAENQALQDQVRIDPEAIIGEIDPVDPGEPEPAEKSLETVRREQRYNELAPKIGEARARFAASLNFPNSQR